MKRWQVYTLVVTFLVPVALFFLTYKELKSSNIQSIVFSKIAEQISFSVRAGGSSRIRFPRFGPYDVRLGYTSIPGYTKKLLENSFQIESQAEISPRLLQLTDLRVFPIYHEKKRGGLTVLDNQKQLMYSALRPTRSFASFGDIPPLVVDTLLFIENREILDTRYPFRNPSVEWDRFGKALLEKAIQEIYPERSAPGGSTLATQLEKYRHGFEGRTTSAQDKLQQMVSASLRAYLDGRDTTEARRKIISTYVNSIPLAALPGFGEVNGLGDGLWAWYDADLEKVSALLRLSENELSEEQFRDYTMSYKQVLSLFLAHRRPSHFLLTDVNVLNKLTDDYLELLLQAGIISEKLKISAEETDIRLRTSAPPSPAISFVDRKAVNTIRNRLLDYLAPGSLYDLDQLDMTVESSIESKVQDAVTATLRSLADKEIIKKVGLNEDRTLGKGDPARVIYSVTIYEHREGVNYLRLQTDNYDNPFNINEGARLDLGSTAKLRTLTNYLEIVDQLHVKLSVLNSVELKDLAKKLTDPISQWALAYMLQAKDKSLSAMLKAAMLRTYSASPAERFFTGGGVHYFENFKSEDNAKTPSVAEAFRHSINLPFIRLMRDVVRYYMAQIPGSPTKASDKLDTEARQEFLSRFAEREGGYFLENFYRKYQNLNSEERVQALLQQFRLTPTRLAVIFRSLWPEKNKDEFFSFLKSQLISMAVSEETAGVLYDKYGVDKFSLSDRGFLIHLHPLELWLVHYLLKSPKANFKEVLNASFHERQEVYNWLFKSKNKNAQDSRIRILVEQEAFLEIHRAWQNLGYPFASLVPSYASAIGSSGDRPAALAELIGIILNDGVQYPRISIKALQIAKDTPFETNFVRQRQAGVRKLKSEIAVCLKSALQDIVENGTARRVNKSFVSSDGQVLEIGGKTGTGDHRYETFGKGGQLISSRVVNRTATFAFFIGRSFFGVVSAHVQGEDAAKYDFTSALAASILKVLSKDLNPMIDEALKTQITANQQV